MLTPLLHCDMHIMHPSRLASPMLSKPNRLGSSVLKFGAGPGRRSLKPASAVLCSLALSSILPWAAAHGPGILESVGEGGLIRETVVQVFGGITGSSASAALAWTTISMLLYSARRAHLHGLSMKVVLARHFINGFDEQRHPYFPVAFAGWLLFLSVYIPVELALFIFARCDLGLSCSAIACLTVCACKAQLA